MGFEKWLGDRLNKTKESGKFRTVKTMNAGPSPIMEIDGRKQLVFSSNNYLGLANDERCIYAAETILHQFGVGSSGTGITTGYTKWHLILENKLAQFINTEATILFSDGSLAIFGVLLSIPEKGDVILCDQFNHVSILDGCQLSYAESIHYLHVNMEDLEEKLRDSQDHKRRFIVTKGVFSEDGAVAPLDKIMSLAKQYQAHVIVDDSHGIGIFGEKGRGTCEYFNVRPDIIIGSLSNAVGAEGGFVCGSKVLIDFLRNHAKTFVYHPSIPPSICAAAYAALEIIETNQEIRKQIFTEVNYARNQLGDMGFYIKGHLSPIITVVIGDPHQAEAFSTRLEEEGIFVPLIPQPTNISRESSINITITANHTHKDIKYLLSKFQMIGKEMNII
ncbi:aminotransferase class I/II-fold pyridoxal phosphate-dependent enzyme [Bacillus marasmi]|uniref:aminotransferase class I/II-fold pyridoxal phosphate-dependent enzyme n=1 Tax=Bacillus marasmi TaxID=1926279 RepID=UPI0011C9DACF|nr:pyridoxal phosphate-dependent aminotransferase family protein [Bacillus marasmi]